MYAILNMHPTALPSTHDAANEAEINQVVRRLWDDPEFALDSMPEHGVKILRRNDRYHLVIIKREKSSC